MTEIPADLDRAQDEAEKRLQAIQKARQDEQARLEASLRSLRGNPDFAVWINDYFGKDVEAKLDQLRRCSKEDLAEARQRWLDSEALLQDLREAASPPVTSIDTDSRVS
jgi:hypothetical protein